MDNPGPFVFTINSAAFSLASAGTFVGDWIQNFAGVDSVSLQAAFSFGGGGGTATIYFQTSIDQGQTPIDIFAPQFTTASAIAAANLSAMASMGQVTPSQQSLTPNTASNNGLLGDRFRAVVVVSAPYTGASALALSGCAR
jgi:hypothetical protein